MKGWGEGGGGGGVEGGREETERSERKQFRHGLVLKN